MYSGVPHSSRFIDVLLKSHVIDLIGKKFKDQPEVANTLFEFLLTAKGINIIENTKIQLGSNEDEEEVKISTNFLTFLIHFGLKLL